MEKAELREKIRNLKLLNFENKDKRYFQKSSSMIIRIFNFPKYKNSKNCAFFASKMASYEIFTDELINYSIEIGKVVYLPRCVIKTRDLEFIKINDLSEDTEIGSFSLREPKLELNVEDQELFIKNLELIFVPGMAFDIFGNRLGFGSGYYDKFLNILRKINRRILVIGLGFDFQIFKQEIPHDKKDARVDYIISPQNIIKIEDMSNSNN